jgi:hypothetical protein
VPPPHATPATSSDWPTKATALNFRFGSMLSKKSAVSEVGVSSIPEDSFYLVLRSPGCDRLARHPTLTPLVQLMQSPVGAVARAGGVPWF